MTVDTSARDIDPVPDDATIDATNERLGELAGHLNAVNAALVDETFALLATGAWQQGGKRTPSAFLQWRLGLSKARADEIVRIAERRDDFPTLMAAFGRGELSLEEPGRPHRHLEPGVPLPEAPRASPPGPARLRG